MIPNLWGKIQDQRQIMKCIDQTPLYFKLIHILLIQFLSFNIYHDNKMMIPFELRNSIILVNDVGFMISEEDIVQDQGPGLITQELLCCRVSFKYEKGQRKFLT